MTDEPSAEKLGDDTPVDGGPTRSGIPMLGLGTYRNTDHDRCAESVRTALELGYRHVDTAQMYGNEAAVGDGLEAADVDRDEIFLATKVTPANLSSDDVHASTRESLEKLGVDAVDLLYVHWPSRAYDPEETLTAFAELVDDGLVANVGVSNFGREELAVATDVCDVPILANQIEVHPLLPQDDLRETCAEYGIEVVAYCPLARTAVFDQPEIRAVAEKHDATPAQVSLAWAREHGVTTIPKASSEAHIGDNWRSLEVDLDDEDHDRIDSIDERRRVVDPGMAPWN